MQSTEDTSDQDLNDGTDDEEFENVDLPSESLEEMKDAPKNDQIEQQKNVPSVSAPLAALAVEAAMGLVILNKY